jgi:predicted transcriptional regulator YheO
MENISDELTTFVGIMKMVAATFGDNCEIVLHDWSKGYDKSIVAIENGYITKRKVGDCGSNLGLEVMRGTVKGDNIYNYITKTKDNKTLRSSTAYIRDDNNEIIGALCINIDITKYIEIYEMFDRLTMINNNKAEYFANDVGELLDFLLSESLKISNKPVDEMTKEEKMACLKFLDEKGAFLITKSGNKVCKFFNISKYTLYNYLDEIRNPEKNGEARRMEKS